MIARLILATALVVTLGACGKSEPADESAAAPEIAPGDYERGPHRGRMLRDGDFALEVTIFETNVPPQYRLYAYRGGKPVKPSDVEATVQLKRLDGEVNLFTFKPEQDFLTGSLTVVEPHSFDVAVKAKHDGKTHDWAFASRGGYGACLGATNGHE